MHRYLSNLINDINGLDTYVPCPEAEKNINIKALQNKENKTQWIPRKAFSK